MTPLPSDLDVRATMVMDYWEERALAAEAAAREAMWAIEVVILQADWHDAGLEEALRILRPVVR